MTPTITEFTPATYRVYVSPTHRVCVPPDRLSCKYIDYNYVSI